MGWTSLHRERGVSHVEFFSANLSPEQKILASHTVGRGEFYAAVQDTTTGEVWALVVLMQWSPASYFNFTYKTMSDSCGPNVDGAPLALLDLLTPTESEWANQWRARCRERCERKARNAKALVNGATVRLPRALRFNDGMVLDTFTYRRRGKRSGLYVGERFYRIPGWRELNLEITAPYALGATA